MNEHMETRRFSFGTFKRRFRIESNNTLQEVVQSLRAMSVSGSQRDEMSVFSVKGRSVYGFQYSVYERTKFGRNLTAYGEGHIWEDDSGLVIIQGTARIEPWYASIGIGLLIFLVVMTGFRFEVVPASPVLLFLVIIAGFTVVSYCYDRNRIVDRMSAVLTASPWDQQHSDKGKHLSELEKGKRMGLSLESAVALDISRSENSPASKKGTSLALTLEEAVALSASEQLDSLRDDQISLVEKEKHTTISVDQEVRPNSIWNDAISEYDDRDR